MKINRVVCDLCPGDAPRTARKQIKLYDLSRPNPRRGAPTPENIVDLCDPHWDQVLQMLATAGPTP